MLQFKETIYEYIGGSLNDDGQCLAEFKVLKPSLKVEIRINNYNLMSTQDLQMIMNDIDLFVNKIKADS